MLRYCRWIKKDRQATNEILRIVIPGLIQGFILSLVNVVDVFVIGNLLPEKDLNGSSLGVQIFSLDIFMLFAVAIASNVYAGQLMHRDQKYLRQTTNFKILLSLAISVLWVVLILAVGQTNVLKIFFVNQNHSNSKAIIQSGVLYLDWILPAFLLVAITIPLTSTLNIFQKAHVGMWASLISAVVNAGLSVGLTFVTHDVSGAAIATLISRFLEMSIVIGYLIVTKPKWLPTCKIWQINSWIAKKCAWAFLLVLPSELLYPIFLLLQTILIVQGSPDDYADILAAANIVIMALELFFSMMLGFYNCIPIFIGRHLGDNKVADAKVNAEKIMGINIVLISCLTIVFLSMFFWWSHLFTNLNANAMHIANFFILGQAVAFWFYANAVQVFSVLRSGGKQWLISLCDQGPNYFLYLPLLFVLLRYSNLPPAASLMIIPATNIVQFIASQILFSKMNWSQNLVSSLKPEKTIDLPTLTSARKHLKYKPQVSKT